MASTRKHFADAHPLVRSQYSSTAPHTCDLCGSRLAGVIGYRCDSCNLDAHEACADYFQQSISFFAHPWHAVGLSRIPIVGCTGLTWTCDLCREGCTPGSFVYCCAQCGFVVHPVCTMLPQVIHSSLHKEHYLHLVPSRGRCSSCRGVLPVWHYRCGLCAFNIHISCVGGGGGGGGGDGGGGGGGGIRSSPGNNVAKYLMKQSFKVAINLATNGMASAVLAAISS
jgi:hypothetical protein